MKLISSGIILLLFSTFTFYLFIVNFRNDQIKSNWPKVNAKIISSKIIKDVYVGQSGGPTSRATSKPIWKPIINYEFIVKDKKFIGNTYSNSSSGSVSRNNNVSPEPLMKLIKEKYAAGSIIDIYYSPTDPNQNFIVYEKRSHIKWILALGIVFLLAGATLIIKSVKQ